MAASSTSPSPSPSPSPARRGARLRSAILTALGVAVLGLGALPAQEAQAAGLVTGIRHVSALERAPVTEPASDSATASVSATAPASPGGGQA